MKTSESLHTASAFIILVYVWKVGVGVGEKLYSEVGTVIDQIDHGK